jgi:hypothetical protein
VADLHQQIDGGARLTLVLTVAGVSGAPVLATHGWWNALWISLLALALIAYRGTISAAALLRPVIETAYDLHRFDLIRRLRLRLPETLHRERADNRKLSSFWAGTAASPLTRGAKYDHTGSDVVLGQGDKNSPRDEEGGTP